MPEKTSDDCDAIPHLDNLSAGDRVVIYGAQRPTDLSQTLEDVSGLGDYELISGLGFIAESAMVTAQADKNNLSELTDLLNRINHGQLDVAVIPRRIVESINHVPPLLIFDVDSTLITHEVIELLAAHAGREAEVKEVTDRAMKGEIDFTESLHQRVAVLAGLPESVLADVAETVVATTGARELIEVVHRHQGAVYAVSGGFNQILKHISQALNLDGYRANELKVSDNLLTGKVIGEVVDASVKASQLKIWRESHAAQHNVKPEEVIVIATGDGANDIQMLDSADFAIAFQAKPALRKHADHELDLPTLDVLRVFLGY